LGYALHPEMRDAKPARLAVTKWCEIELMVTSSIVAVFKK